MAIEAGPVAIAEGDFRIAEPQLSTLDADAAARLAAIGALLDGRPAGRFRGEGETVDPVAGHIPGARSLPALELVSETGELLAAEQLRSRFEQVGITSQQTAGAYCGSGIQACHLALAAAAAGVNQDLAIYPGSWSGWITDPSRPVALGE